MSAGAALLALLLGIWWWFVSLRAREYALELARRGCLARGVRLLDHTVARCGTRLVWDAGGVRVQRAYCFEFSATDNDRYPGRVVLRGLYAEEVYFAPLPAPPE